MLTWGVIAFIKGDNAIQVVGRATGPVSGEQSLDLDGNFRSRLSAQFPGPLCKAFVDSIQGIVCWRCTVVGLDNAAGSCFYAGAPGR